MSEIRQFYAGKNVFITGATGFIGKVLVEKILRDCDEINSMYLLIRSGKRGFEKRCTDYFNHVVFDNIRQNKPKQLDKVKIFSGDLLEHDLGLSNETLQEIYDSVHIVLHTGANVRFDLEIWEALNTNTLGTHRMLELAKRIKYLEIFVYVSTTYSQSYLKVTEECHYKSQFDTWTLVKACKRFDENTMNALQAKILGDFPNTYSFSKHLSEDLVFEYRNEFPICVIRPSVVISALKDPMPNYCEGLNGYFGFAVGVGRGVIQTFYLDNEGYGLIVPVDTVANAVITTSWLHGTRKNKQIQFYNASMPHENSGTFHSYVNIIKDVRSEIPFDFAIWYPNGYVTSCIYYHYIRLIIYQILPAIFLDILLRLFSQPPILMKVQRKLISITNCVLPYCSARIRFTTDRFASIHDHKNQVDQFIFNTNISKLDKRELIIESGKGVRKFICKEKEENIPRANTTMNILFGIHVAVHTTIAYYLMKFIWSRYLSDLLL